MLTDRTLPPVPEATPMVVVDPITMTTSKALPATAKRLGESVEYVGASDEESPPSGPPMAKHKGRQPRQDVRVAEWIIRGSDAGPKALAVAGPIAMPAKMAPPEVTATPKAATPEQPQAAAAAPMEAAPKDDADRWPTLYQLISTKTTVESNG